MMDSDSDERSRKAAAYAPAEIPGDPFPWEPDPARVEPQVEPFHQPGATSSPAEPGDLSSYDLGGGD